MTLIITRLFWIVTAFLNILMGIVGLIVPVMPASPFLILAILCIKKASPQIHQHIVQTRPFVWLQRRVPVLGKWLG